MTLTLDVEHDSSTDTLRILGPDDLGDADTPSLQSARIERKLTRQPDAADTAEVVVYRDAWTDVTPDLDRTDDRLVIREDGTPIFGGRLADFERDGVVVSVLIDGPKRDAIDAEPSAGNDVYPPQADSSIVTDELLARVPTADAGTVETVDGGIAFSESHASPGKSIEKLARDADAEVRYRTTDTGFELDYVARLGSDRTSETLSPSSATVLGEPRVREQVTEDVTHVRVLGAGEGTAQVDVEAVADSYSADDRAVYRQRTDKDIQEQSRAQSLAETLVTEYDGAPEYVEVEVEVPRSVDPALGDEFTVQLPAHGINTTLRVTTAERLVDAAGDRYRVVLSNRRHTADLQGAERAVKLESLSEGNPGQYYALSDGEGWDAVDSGEPFEFSFYRPPNTIGELRSVLRLESRPYRLRAAQSGHSHSVSLSATTGDNADFNTIEEATSDFFLGETTPVTVLSQTFSTDASEVRAEVSATIVDLGAESSGSAGFILRLLRDGTAVDEVPVLSLDKFSGVIGSLFDPVNPNGATYEVRLVETIQSGSVDVDGEAVIRTVGKHTHDINETQTTDATAAVEPGIVEQTDKTVSGVDVTVGGETVAAGLDAPIDETIDLSGELSDGQNDVQITSDSLGELRARVEYEAIKNAESR